jgi:hypothetical protein
MIPKFLGVIPVISKTKFLAYSSFFGNSCKNEHGKAFFGWHGFEHAQQ